MVISYKTGMFVKSKAGHDKGGIYVIIKVDGEFLFLADGKIKTMDHPKKKKAKHVECLTFEEKILQDDTQIKKMIKEFRKNQVI